MQVGVWLCKDLLSFFLWPKLVCLQVAIRNSFKTFWPGITLLGCYFHFSQLIWRRVKGIFQINVYKSSMAV